MALLSKNQKSPMTHSINSLVLPSQDARALLASLLSRLPCLLEGPPGIGKTETAKTVSTFLRLSLTRIQCTSDTLPSDVVGFTKINPVDGTSQIVRGPLFGEFVLVDEINRAPPSTQSAFLEGMAEQQVTVEGETLALPLNQVIIATQNPREDHGTHPLPKSQLDRFAVRIRMTYPEPDIESDIIAGRPITQQTFVTEQSLDALMTQLKTVTLPESSLNYLMAIIDASRQSSVWTSGLSTRAGIILKKVATGLAAIDQAKAITFEHVQQAFLATAPHRLTLSDSSIEMSLDVHESWLHQIPFPV